MIIKSARNEQHVRDLADLFNAASIDGTVTYTQMRRIIGDDPQAKRYLVAAAMRLSNRECGAIFKPIQNVGYQRIRDGVSIGAMALDKARRATRRGISVVSNWMDKTNLSDDDLRRGYQVRTQMSLINAMTSRRAAPDLSEVDLTTYRDGDHTKQTLDALKSARDKKRGG